MRKASYIIALSLITVFLTGHYFIYKSVLKSHKKEFKSYIRSHFAKIEQIEISPSELYTNNNKLTWLDENKEICLNGIMYDIISIKSSGTVVVLSVVNDIAEKDLMKRYQKQFNDLYENGNTGKKSRSFLEDFLSLKFFQNSFAELHLLIANYVYFNSFNSDISVVYLGVQTPPPLL